MQIFTQKDSTIGKFTLKSEINKSTQYLIIAGDGLMGLYICFSQFTMFHIDNIIKLQLLYSQISRLNWSELDKNTIHKAV